MFYSVVERANSGKVIPRAAVMLLCCHSFHVYIMFFCSHCMQQILESVNYCHIHGIVHRDLKVSHYENLPMQYTEIFFKQ